MENDNELRDNHMDTVYKLTIEVSVGEMLDYEANHIVYTKAWNAYVKAVHAKWVAEGKYPRGC